MPLIPSASSSVPHSVTSSTAIAAMTARQYEVPPQLEAMLLEFTVNVLISQPADLAAFAARYFSRLRTGSVGSVGACNQLSPGDRSGSRRGSAASDHSSVFSEDEGKN